MRLQDYPFVRNLRKAVNDKEKWAEIYKELKKIPLDRISKRNDTLSSAFVWGATPQKHAFWNRINNLYTPL